MKKSKGLIIAAIVVIFIVSFIGSKGEVVENLEIPVGVGNDIDKNGTDVTYHVPALIYVFGENGKTDSMVIDGAAKNIGETRSERGLKSSKKFLLGLNRVFLFSENTAQFGVKNVVDIWVNNPEINDRAMCAVCKGKSKDILNFKIDGYSNSSEYIEGMIKNLNQFNFFAPEYSVIDMIVRIDAEGRNLVLPYIEITDEGIKTTGIAIFKHDKMVTKAGMEDTRIINMLRENKKVKGILTLQKSPKEYVNFYTDSKKKVKCYRENGKYKFIINLNLKGSIMSNELYKNIYEDPEKMRQFENDMEVSVKKQCENTIDKIQHVYKVDVLDLGRVAAAKYGRGTETDWNKEIEESDIEVNVKVKVKQEGRGEY